MKTDSKSVIMTDQPVTMVQLLKLFSQLNNNKLPTEIIANTPSFSISEKLNHRNYTKWSRLMHLAISGRGQLNHIITQPPSLKDPVYNQWARQDSIVISWIIETIDPVLVNQFLHFPTARTLWKGIETLYSSHSDGLQIFDLTVKTNKIEQGTETIEKYYSRIITHWKKIDRRQPNPMKYPEDIITYNRLTQQNQLYQILAGIIETFDKDRRDILLQDPLPTVQEAYASIRRKMMRRGGMSKEPSSEFESSGTTSLTSKGDRKNLTDMMIKTIYGATIVEIQGTPKMSALSWWDT